MFKIFCLKSISASWHDVQIMYCTAFMKCLQKMFLLNKIENPVQILCLSGVDRQQGHDRLISVKLAEETHGLVLSALISLIT